MTKQANQVLGVITIVLFLGGIVFAFALDQLWIGIAMFIVGLVIILFRVIWSIAGWADETLHRWTDKNLAPKDGVDVTFEIERKDDED